MVVGVGEMDGGVGEVGIMEIGVVGRVRGEFGKGGDGVGVGLGVVNVIVEKVR